MKLMKEWRQSRFFIVLGSSVLGIVGLTLAFPTLAEWAEPTCDPAADPNACNISAPLNVSPADQTKTGALQIQGTLTAGSAFTLLGGTAVTNGSLTLPQNSIVDSMVSNTLTASLFEGSGSTSTAVDLDTAEVNGKLPTTNINDVWVNTAGDTMTSSLFINGKKSGEAALDIDLTGTGVTKEYGLSIVSTTTASGTNNGFPLYVEVQGSATRGIYVTTQATSGTGVYVNAQGTGSKGIHSIGQANGVYGFGGAVNATGVTGQSVSDNSMGVFGYASDGVDTYGVKGESEYGTGIYGISNATDNAKYGVQGCKGSICGSLGANSLGGYFTHDVLAKGEIIADQVIEIKEQTLGINSYYPGTIKRTITSRAGNLGWDNVRWLGNDGDEGWMIVDNNATTPTSSEIVRFDAQTGRIITVSTLGGNVAPFYDAVLTQNSLITIQGGTSSFDAGKIWQWDKAYADLKSVCPTSPSSCGDSKLHKITSVGYDGTYLWAGRTVGGQGSADAIIRFSYNGNWTYQLLGDSGINHKYTEVSDFEIDSQYVYVLAQRYIDGTGEIKTQILQINPDTNQGTNYWELASGYSGKDMVFDGRNLWIVYEASDGKDGIAQIDLKDPTTGGPLYSYDLHTTYASFDGPNSITFDGSYLWVALGTSETMARVIPFSENDHTSLQVVQNQFVSVGRGPRLINFDGEHIWAMTGGSSYGATTPQLTQVISGRSYGEAANGSTSGITFYAADTVNASPYCLRVKAGALKLDTGVCPVK